MVKQNFVTGNRINMVKVDDILFMHPHKKRRQLAFQIFKVNEGDMFIIGGKNFREIAHAFNVNYIIII